ncbi:hypothetical protein PanWU01x14_277510, partial [Parasponia andersonii]
KVQKASSFLQPSKHNLTRRTLATKTVPFAFFLFLIRIPIPLTVAVRVLRVGQLVQVDPVHKPGTRLQLGGGVVSRSRLLVVVMVMVMMMMVVVVAQRGLVCVDSGAYLSSHLPNRSRRHVSAAAAAEAAALVG